MDKLYYKNQLKNDPSTNQKFCYNKDSKNDPNFIMDSIDITYILAKNVRENFKLQQGIEWLLGLNMYVQDIQNSLNGEFKGSKIERGHIVEYDMFGSVGSEQKKKRPAIVLLVNGDIGVIIAPIGKSSYKSGKEYHISLDKFKLDQGNMKFNCGIKLEQIRYIDKNRITGRYGKVSNSDKLDEIDSKLTKNMSESFYQKYELLKIEFDTKSKEILDRDEQIIKLQQRVQELEKGMGKIDQSNLIITKKSS